MLLIVSKLASIFIDPAGFTLLVLAAGVVFAVVLRRPRVTAALLVFGFLSLLVFSSPITAHFLMRGLEGQYPPPVSYGPASAVVLLGGSTIGKVPPRVHIETNHAANRIFHAARVFRQSESPRLVLTGGLVGIITDDKLAEAYSMFELLHELFGIDTSEVILESRSQNTRENALFTKAALEEAGLGSDIILVTSANHMPRSVAIFEKAGFTVTPAPTGYFANSHVTPKPLAWLPSSNAMFQSMLAIREYCGFWAYKIMGWV